MREFTKKHIEDFQNYLKNEEKSDATIERYIRDLKGFFIWLKGNKIDMKILLTKGDVLNYKTFLLEKYAPSSTNSIISSLNSFFSYEEWYELKIKTVKIQRQIFASKERELTKREYARLLSVASERGNRRLFLLLQTMCSTGIRVSELKFITVESIRYGRAEINLKGKLRFAFLPRELCEMLAEYCKERGIFTGSVFVSRSGTQLDRSNIWSDMKRLCRRAGVPEEKVFPHNLRHLFARTFYGIEKDIAKLADILGHSSINTTRIYIITTGNEHRQRMENMRLII